MTDIGTADGGRGWWRRNRWGVLLLVPVIALGLAEPTYDQWHRFWDRAPRTPVGASSGGWATLGGSGFRLDSLTTVSSLPNDFGSPITLPSGLSVWTASITFRGADLGPLYGCQLRLLDAAGTAYDADPGELADAGFYDGTASCTPASDVATPPATWTNVEYFVTPAGVRPTAVRVVLDADLPTYVLLSR